MQFKASQMEPIEPGNTIPDQRPSLVERAREEVKGMFTKRTDPAQIEDNLRYIPQFESLRAKVNKVKGEINDVKLDRVRFDSEVEEERAKFDAYVRDKRKEYDDKLVDLNRHLVTYEDQAQQHIKSVWPEKMLVDDPNATNTEPNLPATTPMESIDDA
jgi:hypothetical protein